MLQRWFRPQQMRLLRVHRHPLQSMSLRTMSNKLVAEHVEYLHERRYCRLYQRLQESGCVLGDTFHIPKRMAVQEDSIRVQITKSRAEAD